MVSPLVCGVDGGRDVERLRLSPSLARKREKKSEPWGRHGRRLEKKKNEGGGAGDSSFFVRERKRTLVF